MRMLFVVPAALGLVLTCAALAVAAGRSGSRVFYLTVHPRQCIVSTTSPKWVEVVPCSDPAHNMEVYAVVHGGWGHGTPPTASKGLAIARPLCLSAFQRLTGHPLAATLGWNAFWANPGAEAHRYGDKIICSLRQWPHFGPLGPGWHVH